MAGIDREENKDLNKRGLKNEVKGTAKEIEGKVRKGVGNITGNTSEQIKGTAKEIEGKVQKTVGKAQREVAEENETDDA